MIKKNNKRNRIERYEMRMRREIEKKGGTSAGYRESI